MKLDNWDKEILQSAGLDYTKFNDTQLAHLLQPSHAPENYYMDGEITAREADNYWKVKLLKLGVRGNDYKKALKLIR